MKTGSKYSSLFLTHETTKALNPNHSNFLSEEDMQSLRKLRSTIDNSNNKVVNKFNKKNQDNELSPLNILDSEDFDSDIEELENNISLRHKAHLYGKLCHRDLLAQNELGEKLIVNEVKLQQYLKKNLFEVKPIPAIILSSSDVNTLVGIAKSNNQSRKNKEPYTTLEPITSKRKMDQLEAWAFKNKYDQLSILHKKNALITEQITLFNTLGAMLKQPLNQKYPKTHLDTLYKECSN
jgi:hypothetical protein